MVQEFSIQACPTCHKSWLGVLESGDSHHCPYCKIQQQQAEIVRWRVATGRHDPEEITYTQDLAVFWQRKAELYATQRDEAQELAEKRLQQCTKEMHRTDEARKVAKDIRRLADAAEKDKAAFTLTCGECGQIWKSRYPDDVCPACEPEHSHPLPDPL